MWPGGSEIAPTGITNKRGEKYRPVVEIKISTVRLLFFNDTIGKLCFKRKKLSTGEPEWNCVSVNVIVSYLTVVPLVSCEHPDAFRRSWEVGRLRRLS